MVLKVSEQSTDDHWSSSGESLEPATSDSDVNTSTGSSGERSTSPSSLDDVYEKPAHSYVALISMAILSSPDKRMMLGDIYNYVQESFPYYKHMADKAWRNSIRHNLSLNECFAKSGRAEGNKGHYWSIHPNCVEEFARGDYRRRQARRRTRRRPASSATTLPSLSYVEMTSVPTHMNQASYARTSGSPPGTAAPSCYYGQRQQPYPSMRSHLNISAMRGSHCLSPYDSALPSHMGEAMVAPPNVQLPQALMPQMTPSYTPQMTSFNITPYPYQDDWTSHSAVPLPTYIDDFASLQGVGDLPSLREALLGLSALAN